METSQSTTVPFDKGIFATRLKNKRVSSNDLLNQPCVEFTKNQLMYYKKAGVIPKKYLDQIETALENISFKDCKRYSGRKYVGTLVDFGPSEYRDLIERCKKMNTSLTNVICLEHISSQTIYKYKKERHIPSDLLDQINRRLRMMETENAQVEVVEEPVVETKVEAEVPVEEVRKTKVEVKPKTADSNFGKVVQNLKKVVHCNGEANLNLNNISERYECDVETFVNSVFSLVSSESYVIFTTYSNGKPVFTLSEPM